MKRILFIIMFLILFTGIGFADTIIVKVDNAGAYRINSTVYEDATLTAVIEERNELFEGVNHLAFELESGNYLYIYVEPLELFDFTETMMVIQNDKSSTGFISEFAFECGYLLIP